MALVKPSRAKIRLKSVQTDRWRQCAQGMQQKLRSDPVADIRRTYRHLSDPAAILGMRTGDEAYDACAIFGDGHATARNQALTHPRVGGFCTMGERRVRHALQTNIDENLRDRPGVVNRRWVEDDIHRLLC